VADYETISVEASSVETVAPLLCASCHVYCCQGQKKKYIFIAHFETLRSARETPLYQGTKF
jgi:hypothetical protein